MGRSGGKQKATKTVSRSRASVKESGSKDVLEDGTIVLRNAEGLIHCEDGPAIIFPDGRQEYRQNGKLHREDGPAMILSDGTERYYKDDYLHREDGPAIILPDGRGEYRQNGRLHREDGPAVIYPDGRQEYRRNGKLHREDGPALIYPETSGGSTLFNKEEYWENGELIKTVTDRYSSDIEGEGFSVTETYDSDGELHSFNGEPSHVSAESGGYVEELYHNNGELIDAESNLVHAKTQTSSSRAPETKSTPRKSPDQNDKKQKNEDPVLLRNSSHLDDFESGIYKEALQEGHSKEDAAKKAREEREVYEYHLNNYDGQDIFED